jgi:hypothetical protein
LAFSNVDGFFLKGGSCFTAMLPSRSTPIMPNADLQRCEVAVYRQRLPQGVPSGSTPATDGDGLSGVESSIFKFLKGDIGLCAKITTAWSQWRRNAQADAQVEVPRTG